MRPETIDLRIGSVASYDELVHGSAAQASLMTIASKPLATRDGNPGIVVAFMALVDGRPVRVQAATTLRIFVAAARALAVAHGLADELRAGAENS